MMMVIVLQTIAANLGSMLTPVGNPQNLYLYSVSGMSVTEFMKAMLGLTAVSGILLCLCCVLPGHQNMETDFQRKQLILDDKGKLCVGFYVVLFIASLLSGAYRP